MPDESDINQSCVVFVVDTEHYAGNFEREIADYLTMWQTDQDNDYVCRNKNGKEYFEDEPGYVSSVGVPWPSVWSGDNCCFMFVTPGKNIVGSVGVCFDKLTKDQIAILTIRAQEFCDNARELSGKSYVAEKIPMIGVRCFKRKIRKAKDEAYSGD